VAEGAKEDKESWTAFLRGLKGVELFVSDKCLGLVENFADFYPEAKWQRCVVHFYRNVWTAVPHRALEVPPDRLHHARMIVRHDIAYAAETALLQLREHLAPTGLRLRLGDPAAEHLAVARGADPDGHQHALAHHRAAPPNLLIPRVEDEVGILFRQRPRAPLGDLRVQLRGQRRHLALRHLQPALRFRDRAHLARRDALHVHLQYRQHQRLLAALVALKQLRLELPIAVFGHHQLQPAHPRLQRPGLVPVAPAAPLAGPLIRPSSQKTRHLRFQHLLHHSLHQPAEKILPAQSAFPPFMEGCYD
jgi:hypothetical protein